MDITFHKKRVATLKRRLKKQRIPLVVIVGILLLIASLRYSPTDETINPVAYRPILGLIAKGESGGNYNAYFGNPENTEIHFTNMTIAEVLEWQRRFIEQGNASSAVGKYQIVNTTLKEIVEVAGFDMDSRFDEVTQDKMAMFLLERRGAKEYVNNKLSAEQFAANLAKEWAALPKTVGTNPTESYYASDGINKSNTSISEVYEALDFLQKTARVR